jgi:hypothetical protein
VIMEEILDELRGPPLEASPPAPPIYYPLLPLGAHLLPKDYQEHLKNCNLEMMKKVGGWGLNNRREYKKLFPEKWAEFRDEGQHFTELYAEELEALKAYQALHLSQPD